MKATLESLRVHLIVISLMTLLLSLSVSVCYIMDAVNFSTMNTVSNCHSSQCAQTNCTRSTCVQGECEVTISFIGCCEDGVNCTRQATGARYAFDTVCANSIVPCQTT